MEAMETTDTASRAHERRERGQPAHDYTGGGGGGTFARNELLAWAVERWPITAAVRDAITAEYDGDLGTARDIGQRLGGIPSWHITAIAHALGLLEPRQRARIRDGGSPALPLGIPPTPPPTPTPTTPTPVESSAPIAPIAPTEPSGPIESEGTTVSQFATLPERSADQPDEPTPAVQPPHLYPTRDAICAGCGVAFTSKRYKTGWAKYCSVACANAHIPRPSRPAKTAMPPTPSEAPAPAAPMLVKHDERGVTLLSGGAGVVNTGGQSLQVSAPPAPPPSPRRAMRASMHTLVDALPAGDTWPDSDRSRWLEALTGILDFAIERRPDALDWRADQ